MNTKNKIWIRVIVIVGIFAWPATESYRLYLTTQKMAAAQALERSVRAKLEAARAKHVQVASTPALPATADAKP